MDRNAARCRNDGSGSRQTQRNLKLAPLPRGISALVGRRRVSPPRKIAIAFLGGGEEMLEEEDPKYLRWIQPFLRSFN
ncbi:hypothetical protein IQ235_13030 [Oscillatoriales cyanobacterium LEGE 11467]|uniref:Uncharacterized protein n=1 Tax=Zarconia navalis LEGE 11467 TaxID=1828826 RepID=A0A928VZH9_9CYAN|nr:hypothetical protein [Zarconia navalis]MBE9041702.1 hypothetical protein [Zarconia navalis LEGE 11467]